MTLRPTDEEARDLAKSLISNAHFGSIAVNHPETGHPHVTRIAVGTDRSGTPITLISDLSLHTKALKENPICSLLLGEPLDKGDPLTHPRLTLSAKAIWTAKPELRDHFLKTHPKAKRYIDFADFNFVTFQIISGDLNGGFGKAYHLSADDFGP